MCPFFGADWPAQRLELMPCCNNWSRNRIVIEMIRNIKHKKWGAIMEHHKIPTSDMIHTVVEGLFQQLSTAFVAATGKKHWSTTSERDQTSCHNGTSASPLAPCLSFSRDVITIRRKHSRFTNAYEILKTLKRPKYSQNNIRYCHKLDAQPMGDLFSRLGTSPEDVARPVSNSLPEPPRTTAKASAGWAAGSPEETISKTQKPHGAIFMFRLALNTSLWKIRMATILFLKEKLTRM